jgi:hypothetical protein
MAITHEQLIYSQIIPPVAELQLLDEELLLLQEGVQFKVHGANAGAVENIAQQYWNIAPTVETLPSQKAMAAEGYEIAVNSEGVEIKAASMAGVRHALRTLRQLSEAERGVDKSTFFTLPHVHINDAPIMDFRAISYYWFPETPLWEIEKLIRLAAYYKFNYISIESWGVFQWDSFPELGWKELAVDKAEVKRLVALARDLGVTLFPQLNIFGHASYARTITGKHALLDFHPEYASLLEPDGWTWCLSNPATRQRLTNLVCEAHELFDNPPYFHIGCDEAFNAGTCSSCRRADYKQLLSDHLNYFHDLLQQRGARTMMWHDMLLAGDDPRWKGYTAFGTRDGGMDQLYRDLPRDTIICVWEYEYPETNGKPPHWPTLQFFHENDFDVVATPWLNQAGTASLGEMVVKENMMGMLMGSCHKNHGAGTYAIYYSGARSSWSGLRTEYPVQYREYLNRHMRDVGHDMKITQYVQTGNTQYQVNPHEHA